MLKNYIKIALRSLAKNKAYSIINIVGLCVGLVSCILILLYVQNELSYDRFYENQENIYRVGLERVYPDHTSYYAIIPGGFSEVFAEEIPEVNKSTRLIGFPNFANIVEYENKLFEENYVFFADSTFFEIMDFEILQGDPSQALTNPGNIILTESTAEKYFGNENPIGKTLQINNNDVLVSAVMQDVPENSHIKFDFLQSSSNLGFLQNPNYTSFSSYTYLELVDGADPSEIEAKIAPLVTKYASGQIERNLGVSYQNYLAAGNGYNYFLQNISDVYLHSNMESEIKPVGSITYVYILSVIAGFILLIACINFINLATARSGERAREVGVRKVMGSERSQLIRQFLTESVLVSFTSMLFAILVIQAVLPFFNNLADKNLSLDLFSNISIVLVLIGFTVVVGVLAGLYPALYISSLKAVEVMKGKFQSNAKGKWLRNGLVVLQFSISIILISGTLVVNDQMDFIQNKRLGFDKENVMVIENLFNIEQSEAFKQSLENMSEVKSVGASSDMPGGYFFGVQLQQSGDPDLYTQKGLSIDDNYIETMNINLLSGRSFSEDFSDSLNLILNEAAVESMGLENPIGARVTSSNTVNNEQVTSVFTIIGVVENFNFESLRTGITPLVLFSTESAIGFEGVAAVRLATNNFNATISDIEQSWKNFNPDQPFSYTFLDNDLAQLYEAEQTSGKIFGVFAIIAILIACVGLFGLAAYIAFQRTKEIGVRKVLGASISNVVLLLSKDFAKLVGISFLIATPVSWFLMKGWLSNFAFRTELSVFTFLIAGLLAFSVAIFTISYQAISAAVIDPVKSLKSE